MRTRLIALCTAVLLLGEGVAYCDPAATAGAGSGSNSPAPTSVVADLGKYLHIDSAFHYKTQGGSEGDLAAGFYFDQAEHDRVEKEWHRLQDSETRLTAENASMKKTLAGWQPGWYVLAGALLGGVLLGWYLHSKI